MASKPTFVLVPGMWHRPAFFNKLKDHLSQRGLSSVAIDMPSSATGTNAAIVSREPDIEAIASVIRRILVRGDDVVVLMHSFGGISGSEAVGRILEEEASLRGRGGKIRRLVYVTAFLASEDEMVPVIQGVVDDYAPDFFDVHDGGLLSCNQRAKEWFYGDDLSRAEQEKHFRALGTNPVAPFFEKVRHAPWKQIPSTYVYSSLDRPVPFAMMKHMVQQAREDAAAAAAGEGLESEQQQVFDDDLAEFHVDAAHSAIFLAPERVKEVGDILEQIVEHSS